MTDKNVLELSPEAQAAIAQVEAARVRALQNGIIVTYTAGVDPAAPKPEMP